MSRSTGANSVIAVLLDSTYLLPVFGIAVEGVSDEALLRLRRLAIEKLVRLYYSPISFMEILAKIAREAVKRETRLEPAEVTDLIKIIEEADYLKPTYPNAQAYALAYKMRLLGHKDMIDNILYATASIKGLTFVTMDQSLKNFIQRHRIKGAHILTHHELLRELEA